MKHEAIQKFVLIVFAAVILVLFSALFKEASEDRSKHNEALKYCYNNGYQTLLEVEGEFWCQGNDSIIRVP